MLQRYIERQTDITDEPGKKCLVDMISCDGYEPGKKCLVDMISCDGLLTIFYRDSIIDDVNRYIYIWYIYIYIAS